MPMQQLAPELIVRIFESLASVSDILSLSLACRYFNQVLTMSQKLLLFSGAIDKEMGPMEEILQLLTQNNNEALHVHRSPALSLPLLAQVNMVARVADRFAKLYPSFRWAEGESAERRFLNNCEARRLRRAVYRFWAYTQAFHGTTSPRPVRSDMLVATERLQLLRTWSTDQLYELEDLRFTLEQLVASEICPTDGEISSRNPAAGRLIDRPPRYSARPGTAATDVAFRDVFHTSCDVRELGQNQPSVQELRFRHMQGWGCEIQNFYLVQSFLKCSPAQILWLFENAVSKEDVEQYVELHTNDPWFFESGSMLFHDWATVLHARGIDVQNAREAICNRNLGIAPDFHQ